MRRTALPLTIISTLILMAMMFQGIALTRANPSVIPPIPETPDLNEPSVIVQLPERNKTYNVNTVPYSITVEKPSSWFGDYPHAMIMIVDYILDGNQHIEIADEPDYYERGPFTYKGTLSGLSEGNHTIEVYVRSDSFYDPPDKPRSQQWPFGKAPPQDYYLDTYSGEVYFTVDTTPPAILILSLDNTTYSSAEVPLSFSVDELTSRMTYCVDNVSNITVAGNCTLTELSDGRHSLTVYAWDMVGNIGVSETVTFAVDKQPESTSDPEPFPWLLVIAVVVVVAAVVGVLTYFKKRKHPTNQAAQHKQ